MEEALYDSRAMRSLTLLDLGKETAPDETTILKFHHLLDAHNLSENQFQLIGEYLEENGLKVSRGTIVDTTFISAPSLIKNRNPAIHSTKKATVVLRHKGVYWRGQPDEVDSFGGCHGGQLTRQSEAVRLAVRGRNPCPGRFGLQAG